MAKATGPGGLSNTPVPANPVPPAKVSNRQSLASRLLFAVEDRSACSPVTCPMPTMGASDSAAVIEAHCVYLNRAFEIVSAAVVDRMALTEAHRVMLSALK